MDLGKKSSDNSRICFLCQNDILITCRNYKKIDSNIEDKLVRLGLRAPRVRQLDDGQRGEHAAPPAPGAVLAAGTATSPDISSAFSLHVHSPVSYICRSCHNKLNTACKFQDHEDPGGKRPSQSDEATASSCLALGTEMSAQASPPPKVLQSTQGTLRFKRMSKGSPLSHSQQRKTFRKDESPVPKKPAATAHAATTRRKKLHFPDQVCELEQAINVKLVIHSSAGDTEVIVPTHLQSVCDAIGRGDVLGAVQKLQEIPEAAKAIQQTTMDRIGQECSELCRERCDSNFKSTEKEKLKKWSYDDQERELEEQAPTFLSCLKAAAIRPKIATGTIKPSARKTLKTLRPGIMGAAGSLLYCRNERMNAHQLMTALTVKRGGCGDKAISRLQARGLSVSYPTVLRHQVAFGSNYNGKVHKWRESLEQDMKKEKELADDPVALDAHNKSRHLGYMVNGDNVDMRITPRQMSRSEGTKDLHYFQLIAVKNRIADYSLSPDAPAKDVKAEPLSTFLPSVEDNKALREDWIHLVTQIIGKQIPSLGWMSSVMPQCIKHPYMTETKKKTEVVNLGVLTENENTNDGMVAILSHINQYVPVNEDSSLIPIISGGDLLTCERECNAKMDRDDSDEPMAKWSGLIPVIDDFHTMANLLSVIWSSLYSPSSARDTGTLYAARNFLRAHDVTKDPMKNINAAVELVDKYTEALVVCAALEHFGMESTSANQTINAFDPMTMDPVLYTKQEVGKIIDKYVLHEGPKVSEEAGLVCPQCGKSYKRLNGLRAHQKSKHQPNDAETPEPEVGQQEDGIYNYSCASLSLCLLFRDFQDARRYGDGQRIIRLYKFLLLYFKLCHRTKYSYQTFRLLAQVNCTLSPRMAHLLVWNRFVNHSGTEDGNIEVDRELEFHNRVFKEECHQLHGKVTEKTVKRVSQSAQEIEEVLRNCDKASFVRSKKGKHTKKDTSEDIVSLALLMKKENIFQETPNRHHYAYPSFPKNLLTQLDLTALHGWMIEQISKLS